MIWDVVMWLPGVVLARALQPVTERLEELADTTNAEIERILTEEE